MNRTEYEKLCAFFTGMQLLFFFVQSFFQFLQNGWFRNFSAIYIRLYAAKIFLVEMDEKRYNNPEFPKISGSTLTPKKL